jgi:hypothetical protein
MNNITQDGKKNQNFEGTTNSDLKANKKRIDLDSKYKIYPCW